MTEVTAAILKPSRPCGRAEGIWRVADTIHTLPQAGTCCTVVLQMEKSLTLVGILTVCLLPAFGEDAPPNFERDIRPIFEKNCFTCHGATKPHSNGLDLKTVESILDGANSGTVVVPGKPEASRLWIVVRDGIMPQGGTPLAATDKKLIHDWIEKGQFPSPGNAPADKGSTKDEKKPEKPRL